MALTPLILGQGNSGRAVAQALACLGELKPALALGEPVWLKRDCVLKDEFAKHPHSFLCITNPHGLHAAKIREADGVGFGAILCEKPSAVNLEQVAALLNVKTPTAVFHVYRQMWGPQKIRSLIAAGELGEIISIEGRYWQGSSATKAIGGVRVSTSWKNKIELAGEYDVYLDLASHWVDAACFLMGLAPTRVEGWRSFANAETPHRDTHVQIAMNFANRGRAWASASKTVHGAGNDFEISVIGKNGSASWSFPFPDEITVGLGAERKVIQRPAHTAESKEFTRHGMGWLEGYIEIAGQILSEVYLGELGNYPRLQDNLAVVEAMLKAEWR